MDLTESIVPRSDQVNADDLVGGPITYTIREVRQGAAEQPFDFMLVETDRAYRPSKTMRRLIVAAWGPDASQYTGRRLTLYREPSIKFGGQAVGGIRISAMSHIPKRIDEKFQTTRGKRETFTVNPLPDAPPPAPEPQAIRPAQLTRLHILLKETGYTDRESGLEKLSEIVGYTVESSKHLTVSQASACIEALVQLSEQPS